MALKERPDVMLSGALHGDERVGPVATLEVAKLLATAASCQAGSLDIFGQACTAFYEKYTKKQAGWLARLVSTRRIVIVPAANSNGYYKGSRWEGGFLDPNRDFAFDQDPASIDGDGVSTQCMRSIAGRTLNELFLDHLFQSKSFVSVLLDIRLHVVCVVYERARRCDLLYNCRVCLLNICSFLFQCQLLTTRELRASHTNGEHFLYQVEK